MKKISIGSMFAGVGGIDKAFTNAGFVVNWAIEIDTNACKTYKANHKSKLIQSDVFEVAPDTLEPIDVLCAGFRCQPFSVAGKELGFSDLRGNDFNRVMQFADTLKPSILFLENVPRIKTHDNGNTYKTIIAEISKRGYFMHDAILSTITHANIPQTRSRWFLVAFKNQTHHQKFLFPEPVQLTTTIHDFLESASVAAEFYYTSSSTIYGDLVDIVTDKNTIFQWRRKGYTRKNKNNACPTLLASMGSGGNRVPIVLTSDGIRKLTPLECFRFQGFHDVVLPDDVSNTQLYKQSGNMVTIPLVQRIAENIASVCSDKLLKHNTVKQLSLFDV